MENTDVQAGTVFDDKYEIGDVLGKGASSIVFSGKQLTTGQQVAVKVLSTFLESSEISELRFQREIEAGARLSHPNLIKLIDCSQHTVTPRFIVYEHIQGVTLDQYLQTHGPLDVGQAIYLMGQILEALLYAHGRLVVHGDLKPSNIMVVSEGLSNRLKLLDFGLCTFQDQSSDRFKREIFGTPEYCAPEQLVGGRIDASSDLYSWVMILIECVTGRTPCQNTDVREVVKQQLDSSDYTLPVELERLPISASLRTMIRKDRQSRIFDSSILIDELRKSHHYLVDDTYVTSRAVFLIAFVTHQLSSTYVNERDIIMQLTLAYGCTLVSTVGQNYLILMDTSLDPSPRTTMLISFLFALRNATQAPNASLAVSYCAGEECSQKNLANSPVAINLFAMAVEPSGSDAIFCQRAFEAAGIGLSPRVYTVKGENFSVNISPLTDEYVTPLLIPRNEELYQLQQLLSETGEENQLIVVQAESGMGKSQLLRELCLTKLENWFAIDCCQLGIIAPDLNALVADRQLAESRFKLILTNADRHFREIEAWFNAKIECALELKSISIIVSLNDQREFSAAEGLHKFPLKPFAADDITQLVNETTRGQLYHESVDKIVELSGGNPYYAHALANLFFVRKPVDSFQLEMPLVLERLVLDRLSRNDQALEPLAMAAVLGVEFSQDQLWHMLGREPSADTDESLLRSLSRYLESDVKGGMLTFRFKYPVEQEIIYQSIPDEMLVPAHKQAEIFINENMQKSFPQFAARHAWALKQYQSAAELWHLAAQLCRADADHLQATRYSRLTIDAASRVSVEPDKFEKTLSSYLDSVGALFGYGSKEFASTLDRLEKVTFKDLDNYHELTYRIARHHQGKGRLLQSKSITQSLLRQGSSNGNLKMSKFVLLSHAFTEAYLGEYSASLQTLSALEKEFGPHYADYEEQEIFLSSQILLSWLDFLSGRINIALNRIESLDAMIPSGVMSVPRLMKLSTSANMYRMVGDIPRALSICDEILQNTVSGLAPFWYALTLMKKGSILTRLDSKGHGPDMVIEGLERFYGIDSVHGVTEWEALAAETMLRCNKLDEAERYLNSAQSHIKSTNEEMFKVPVTALWAYLRYLENGVSTEVTVLLENALTLARSQSTKLFEFNTLQLRSQMIGADTPEYSETIQLHAETDVVEGLRRYWRF